MNTTLAPIFPLSHDDKAIVWDDGVIWSFHVATPPSVPSGYARQAQIEASLSNGFRSYDAPVAR